MSLASTMIDHDGTSGESVGQLFISRARLHLTDEYLPKIQRCLEKLSDEQIWWRANDSANSIGNLILHLCGNARQWIVCGICGQPDLRQRQTEFDERRVIPRAELSKLLEQTVADVDTTLAAFNPQQLLTDYPIQGTKSTALAAIFHVTEHFSMHTGQIILLTRMLAGVDLNFYDFSTGKPVHTWHSQEGEGGMGKGKVKSNQ